MRLPIRFLGLRLLGAAIVLLAVRAGDGPVPAAHAQGMVEQTAEYGCSGRPEPFSVPPGVTQLMIEAEGAAGESGIGTPGRGGMVSGTLPVTPGDLLTIDVGCRTGYGFVPGAPGGDSSSQRGGGGGGATGIRDGLRRDNFLSYILVAGGGGGGGGGGFWIVEPTFGCGGGGGGARGDGGGGGGGGLSWASERLSGTTLATADGHRDGKVTIRFTGPAGATPQRFACTGARASYTVPAGVSGVAALAAGGNGAVKSRFFSTGGVGAGLVAFLAVSPGSSLEVGVGCPGAAGQQEGGFFDNYVPGGAGGFGFYRGGSGGTGDKAPLLITGGPGGNGGGGASGIAVPGGPVLLVAAGGGGAGGGGAGGNGGAGGSGSGAAGSNTGAGGGGALGGNSSESGGDGGAGGFGGGSGGGGGGGIGVVVGGGGGGGGGGRNFAHQERAQTVTPISSATSAIDLYPIWRLVACPTPASSSPVPCYNPATASAFVP